MAHKRRRWGSIETIVPGEVYRIRWKNGYKADGSRDKPSKTVYGTYEDAELALAVIRVRLEGGGPDMTYDELWGGIVVPSFDKYGLATRTREDNVRVYNRELRPRIGRDVVAATTPKRVEEILAEMESPWTQRSAFSLWRKMVNLAIHDGLQMANPCDRYVVRKKTVPADRPLLQAHDVPAWMEAIEGYAYEAALLVEAGGGPRVEEGCALTVEDMAPFERAGRLYVLADISKAVVPVKGGRELKGLKTDNRFARRTIAVGWPFAERLVEVLPVRGPLCPSAVPYEGGGYRHEHFQRPDVVTSGYRELCASREGAPYVNPGKLRKSWSTMQGEAQSPDSLVQLQLGHADGTTRGKSYQKLTRKGTLLLADNLARLIAEEAGLGGGL